MTFQLSRLEISFITCNPCAIRGDGNTTSICLQVRVSPSCQHSLKGGFAKEGFCRHNFMKVWVGQEHGQSQGEPFQAL